MNLKTNKTTFLMTSIIALIITTGVAFSPAFGHIDPMPCSGNNPSMIINAVRNGTDEDVNFSNSSITNTLGKVDVGEAVQFKVILNKSLLTTCNYGNGTVNVVDPANHTSLITVSLPLINNTGSGNGTFTGYSDPYIVSTLDDDFSCSPSRSFGAGANDTFLHACAFFGDDVDIDGTDGTSHSSVHENTATAFNNIDVSFVIPWNATTLSNATGTNDNPVIDPLDVVTIVANENFTGTFDGNFTLGNSTDVFDTGICTGGVVNATTGIATLDCQASGTFDTPVGNTCFDVTINAPNPYAPSEFTLFGADDEANECFRIAPPSWNATTLSNATGILPVPVIDPLDVVTIVANENFTGTFDGNFTLGNSTDVFDTGICTGGVVNATTGNATLNCQASGTFDEVDGNTCFDVTINAPSPYEPSVFTLFGLDDADNECFIVNPPEWNATTLANVTGSQSDPVVDPLDVVTILADENFLGTFTGNFTLGNSTDVFDSGDCTGGVVNATTGIATLDCQASGTFDNTIGDTCFDVTINAPSPYVPITDTLFGADDSADECFNILPPEWNATTLANVTGSQSDPVVDPLDVVTILADENFLGTFTGNFTLGNSTDVFDSGDCTGGVVNATTGIATLDCQASGTFDDEIGDICFDVTINAPSPYTPIMETLFGLDDAENECFELITEVPFNAYTMANVTGIVGPTINPGDKIIINGTDGLFGNFTGNATLTFNSTDAVVTTSCSSVSGDVFTLELECAAEVELVEPGQYCWDVTITELTGNYTPSVLNLYGIDDAENECFNVFEGLTPGFWKNNAESFEAGAWFIQNTTDSFIEVFGITDENFELRLANGKLKDPSLDRGDPEDPTLYGALGARGGDENALARHCVAAKLNVENPDVTYPLNYTEVIDQCGSALNGGNSTAINDLKDMLDEWNNFGANISQHWPE